MAVSTADAEARKGTICAPRTLRVTEVRNSRRQLVCRHANIASFFKKLGKQPKVATHAININLTNLLFLRTVQSHLNDECLLSGQ